MTKGQYFLIQLKEARSVSNASLLYGTQAMLVLNFLAVKNKKYIGCDCFHGNGPYGTNITKKNQLDHLRFTL